MKPTPEGPTKDALNEGAEMWCNLGDALNREVRFRCIVGAYMNLHSRASRVCET